MSDKVHIEKGSVQETLIIPLFARMKSAEIYPSIYRDSKAKEILDGMRAEG